MVEYNNRQRLYHLMDAGITEAKELHARTNMPLRTIYDTKRRYMQQLPADRKNGSGRPSTLSRNDSRRICQLAHHHPHWSAAQIKNVAEERGTPVVSTRTIQRKLKESGYVKLVPRKVPLLTPRHKEQRIEFCRQYLEDEMKDVFFTDEATFQFYRVTQPMWSRKGRPNIAVKKFSPKINVWGGISLRGFTSLATTNENINSENYIGILQENLIATANNLYRRWRLVQDNATPHKSRMTTAWLTDNGIRTILWPAASPDLNPIENVWAIVKNDVEKHSPLTLDDWKQNIVQSWNNITPDTRRRLIFSVKRRFQMVLDNEGEIISY